jgi:cytochrome b involved in lipid metabolism
MAPQTERQVVDNKINAADISQPQPVVEASNISPVAIQVDDKVYDANSLASTHPGGELFVKAFAGRDATEAFLSYHRRQFPHSKMKGALIGASPAAKSIQADEEYLELCALVEQVLPRAKSFAPFSYYCKVGKSSSIYLNFPSNSPYLY